MSLAVLSSCLVVRKTLPLQSTLLHLQIILQGEHSGHPQHFQSRYLQHPFGFHAVQAAPRSADIRKDVSVKTEASLAPRAAYAGGVYHSAASSPVSGAEDLREDHISNNLYCTVPNLDMFH